MVAHLLHPAAEVLGRLTTSAPRNGLRRWWLGVALLATLLAAPGVWATDGRKPRPRPILDTDQPWPRRALLISIHNYLYANPVHDGLYLDHSRVHNLRRLVEDVLPRWLHIPRSQIAHLTDSPDGALRRPPFRSVIEKTITNFLSTSRAQDRILVYFIGHAVEIGDEAYLVPLEGELDNAATLIPLKWLFKQLDRCKARQKVLILDTNRFSFTAGLERPDGGPMSKELDALLRSPPKGVQVWSACVAKQQSYETDESPMGAFTDEFYTALDDNALKGKHIDSPDRPIPVDLLYPVVEAALKLQVAKLDVKQTSRLTGQEKDGGAEYDPRETLPKPARSCIPPVVRDQESGEVLVGVLREIGTPPLRLTEEDDTLRADLLPPFRENVLNQFADKKSEGSLKLRKAIRHARAALWALKPGAESNGPPELLADIRKYQNELKVNLAVLQDGYRAPNGRNAERAFRMRVVEDEQKGARLLLTLTDVLEELEAAAEQRDSASKRWKANYDFMLARLELEIVFLYEYQSALGAMRRCAPERDLRLHNGWRLASTPRQAGDVAGRQLGKKAEKRLARILRDYAGTPWEVLARRLRSTSLGLEWRSARIGG